MLWTMLTYPLMSAIQLVSARIGRVTGCGLGVNMDAIWPKPLVTGLMLLLFLANTINIGANLAAMGASVELATGVPSLPITIFFAVLSLTLQMFIPYQRYANILKWLTLALLAYVAVLFTVKIDWLAALKGFVWPSFPLNGDSFTMIVAILGTTISPYLFFWQSSPEVEEIDRKDEAEPLKDAPKQAPRELSGMRLDTFAGMAVSNLEAIAILMCAAATLHASGKTEIGSAADVAEALKPIAGNFAFMLFSIGIVGTGLLSIPVLAVSVAYAFGESQDWKCGLEHKPWEAVGFYSVIAAATIFGLGLEFAPIDPIKALFWSAVINGFVAVPIMIAMMVVVGSRKRMKDFVAPRSMLIFGWAATAVMGVAAIAMLVF
jgi:Mn2+/Fe2+ NRAMP family transporter